MTQARLFEQHKVVADLPEGMSYCAQLISRAEEKDLLDHMRDLPFREFEFHGFKGKRRTVSFGWKYEFSGRGQLQKAQDIPAVFLPLRAVAAKFAHLAAESLQHLLVIEYQPGAGIGWHRDKAVFGEVIGVSLLAPCMIRFRRKLSVDSREIGSRELRIRNRTTWERVKLLAEPCSAYYLTGPARHEWQHSILSVSELRYSITFRTLA